MLLSQMQFEMGFGDFQLALLALTALVAFALHLHGQVKRSYLGACLNALMLCIYHLAIYKVAQHVTVADVFAYLAGWQLGVMASTAFYRAVWRRSAKTGHSRKKLA